MPKYPKNSIFHIAHSRDLSESAKTGLYACESLISEGFIHCCFDAQLPGVIDRYYQGVPDLVLLCIDPSLLRSKIRLENTVGGTEEFPHVYGPLNLDAVISQNTLH